MQFKVPLLGFILGLLFIILVTGCDNGGGHSHSPASVNQETAKLNARLIVADLVTKNEMDTSWAAIAANSAVKNENNATPKWEIVFINKNIADIKKQKFYVFLTLSGDYIGANYSGK